MPHLGSQVCIDGEDIANFPLFSSLAGVCDATRDLPGFLLTLGQCANRDCEATNIRSRSYAASIANGKIAYMYAHLPAACLPASLELAACLRCLHSHRTHTLTGQRHSHQCRSDCQSTECLCA
jgi:hypothetical protein